MAAEIAVPEMPEVTGRLDAAMERLVQIAGNRVGMQRARLNELLRSYALGQVKGRLDGALQGLDYAMERLLRGVTEAVKNRSVRLAGRLGELEALNPRSVLERGYAICSQLESGTVIRSSAEAALLDEMRVSFHDGSLRTEVKERIDGEAEK